MAADRETENALQTKTVRIIKFFLSTICAWPGDALGEKLHWLKKCYRVYLPLQCLTLATGMIHYMTTNDLDFLQFGDAVAAWLLTAVEFVRLILPLFKGYGELFRDFLMSFHLIHFKYKGNHFDKIHKVVEKASYYFTLYVSFTMLFGCILFVLSPLFVNYSNGLYSRDRQNDNITYFQFPLYFSAPFFNPFEHFKLVVILSSYYSYIFTIIVCDLDLLLILMTFQIIGHIKILRKNLESISRPERTKNLQFEKGKLSIAVQYEVYSKEENETIGIILKECVIHHRFIIRFSDKMSNFFGFMLVVNYGFELITCCILLLETTQGDLTNLIRFGPLTLLVFAQLIQISVVFEVLATQSEKLPDSLYSIPWECMDISNQRYVCIILHRMQTPIRVSAMGMTDVGVTAMTGILKTTLSYFAFLKSINE